MRNRALNISISERGTVEVVNALVNGVFSGVAVCPALPQDYAAAVPRYGSALPYARPDRDVLKDWACKGPNARWNYQLTQTEFIRLNIFPKYLPSTRGTGAIALSFERAHLSNANLTNT